MSHSRVSNLSAGRIALGYAVIAIPWIAFADAVVTKLNLHPAVATFKGAGFVVVTALLLYFTIRRLVHGLRAGESRHAVTLASIGDAVIATDPQALVTFLNPAAESLTGWPLAEGIGRPLAEVFHIINEQTRQPVEDPAAKVLRLGTVVGLANHTALVARDGRETPIDDCGAPILDDRGHIAGVVLVFRDVTQRRQAEEAEAFRRANERMELALRGSNVYVWEIEMPDGDFLRSRLHHVNFWEQLGYDPRPPAGIEATQERIHPDDRDPLTQRMRAYLAGETPEFESEIRFRHSDGSTRIMFARGAAVLDAAGKPFRLLGTGVDITDLKRAEEARRASEARFRALVQNSSDMISLFDAEGTVLYHSPAIERLLGYRPQDRIGRNVFGDPIVHPDDLERKRAFLNAIRNQPGAPVTAEFRLRRADGSWREIEAVGQNFLDDPGIAAIVTNCRDITDRKRAEEDIRRAKDEWERTFDSVPDLIAILDERHQVVRANKAMAQRLGTTPQQCVGLPCYQVVHGTDAPPSFCPHSQTLRDLRLHTEEVHEDRLGGDFLVTTTPLMDEQGKFVGAVHVARDVTERKRAEEALRASERRFRIFVDHATDAFFLHDNKDGLLDVNRQACESLGYTRDELIGMHPFDFDPDLTPAIIEEIHRKHDAGETHTFRTQHRRKDGTVFPVEVRDRGFWEGGREFSVSFARDITEQIRVEEALRQSQQDLDRAEEVGQIGWWRLDTQRNALTWSDETRRIFGVPKGTPLSYESFLDAVHPDNRRFVDERWQAAMRGEPYDIEHRIIADGEVKWVREKAYLEFDGAGSLLGGFGIAQDITERKLTEHALQERMKELACLYAVSRDIQEDLSMEELCRRAVEHLVPAMQFPDITVPVIELSGERFASENYTPGLSCGLQAEIRVEGRVFGYVRVYYAEEKPFLIPEEQNLINGIAEALGASFDRKRADEALREARDELERKVAQRTAELHRLNRELRAISNCNQVLLRATDEQSLLQEICRIVCEEAGYRAAWVGYAEHNETKSVRHVAWTGTEEETLANIGITWADTELGRSPCGTAIRTGKTSCMEDCVTDPRGAPWKDIALRHGFRSVVALPLKDEQANTFGCLIICAAQLNSFPSDEIRLLEELAGDLAFGIVTLRSKTARERAEQEVAMLSFALDKGHDAAFLLDEARLCYVNEEACRRLGYTREELLGMSVSEIDPNFPPERWSDH